MVIFTYKYQKMITVKGSLHFMQHPYIRFDWIGKTFVLFRIDLFV